MKLATATSLISSLLPFTLVWLGTDASHVRSQKKQKSTGLTGHIAEKAAQQTQTNRIVGGEDAAVGEFPSFVDWAGCGGTLIHEDIVLTAGHCVGIYTNNIYIGAYEEQSTSFGAELRSVVNRKLHPEYSDCMLANDVAVLKLDTASSFTPIALNDDPTVPSDGDNLVVIGHGVTNVTTQETSTTLQKVTVPFVNHTQCGTNYAALYPVLEDCMLCAGYEEGGSDACYGDSGGPLLKQVGDGYVQVGTTSWGESCALPNFPGVYARISTLKDWIDEQICQMSDNPPSTCPPPPEGTIPIRLEINYDNYPKETGWSITHGCECDANMFQGDAFQKGFVSERLYLTPGEYTFAMTDAYGDGICCGVGQGNATIIAEVPAGDDVVLAEIAGDFTYSTSTEFTVSDDSGPPSLCEDSTTETFFVTEEVGDKDCEWLADNLYYFDYLCAFVDVAMVCPDTCEICDLLDL